ncbi:MAG: hypothetical protein QNJ40_08835 [Xanthomonadales bacterium]|nr:hypothetical protein [Xanthomonadales bacterium]
MNAGIVGCRGERRSVDRVPDHSTAMVGAGSSEMRRHGRRRTGSKTLSLSKMTENQPKHLIQQLNQELKLRVHE